MDESVDTSRSVVNTYVPTYQKERWAEQAEDLGMSLSEFVRTMVQAGRTGFDPDNGKPRSEGEDPRGNVLETRVLRLLSEEPRTWDELLEAVSEDVESRLDGTLERLQERNRVRYSGRDGYTVVEGSTDGE